MAIREAKQQVVQQQATCYGLSTSACAGQAGVPSGCSTSRAANDEHHESAGIVDSRATAAETPEDMPAMKQAAATADRIAQVDMSTSGDVQHPGPTMDGIAAPIQKLKKKSKEELERAWAGQKGVCP